MSESTQHLKLPYIMPSQAQKHVTHNEALRMLDGMVQLCVEAVGVDTVPVSPQEGERHIIGSDPDALWVGKTDQIAAFIDGAWQYFVPEEGWLAWDRSVSKLLAYSGTGWGPATPDTFETTDKLGINATATALERLAVQSQSVLFNHDGSDHRTKLNKAGASDTASLLFQSGFSGRAEFGLPGEDNFVVKVSSDGSTWYDAIRIDNGNGEVSFPASSISSSSDIWHSGNDGAGSGLDADLLDGQDATAFALLSGATFTGDVIQSNIPAFSAYAVASDSTGVLVFTNASNMNNGGHYNNSNGRFTVPVTGRYQFSAYVLLDTHSSSTEYGYLRFRINGVSRSPYFHSSGGTNRSYEPIYGLVAFSLSAGDYVEVELTGIGGADAYGSVYSGFAGHLIG